jgi:hypothetical protein
MLDLILFSPTLLFTPQVAKRLGGNERLQIMLSPRTRSSTTPVEEFSSV